MLAWSSLLVQKIDLRLRGLVVRKLQINRHRVAEVAPHHHAHGQAILFLSGEGVQIAGKRNQPARAGDLFIFPAGREHGYQPTSGGRPICLVLDYERTGRLRAARSFHRHLAPASMNRLHELVSTLPRKGGLALRDYATVAAVVALLFEGRAIQGAEPHSRSESPAYPRVRTLLLETLTHEIPLREIARRAGYQPDYLNRKLRRESGQGLRELRDSIRLELATQALLAGASVAVAATTAGFADPGYFARWFRKRTGHTPRESRTMG